jgi:hypothetical protein
MQAILVPFEIVGKSQALAKREKLELITDRFSYSDEYYVLILDG